MRILFSTVGSYGDLFPYLALGRELARRGHSVTIATSAAYRPQIESAGLCFHAVRPDVALDDRAMIAYVMDARRGSERILRYLATVVRESYADVTAAAGQADLLITHPATLASVLVAKKLRMPWISTVLAPISFLSVSDPPVPAPAPFLHRMRFLGPRFVRAWMASGKRQSLAWIRPLLAFQSELGLPSDAHPLFEGQHSPARVLALFSQRLAAPQPDWPSQTVTTGFCFFDDGALPAPLARFLDDGPPPVVFTLGSSAVGAAGRFFPDSLETVKKLNVRAVFLTGSHPQGLPAALPENAMAVPYAPHAAVFARAAAIVHQGGAGTTAQAMRAGRPMLIVPFAHDQFDNAERVRRLGAAEVLYRSRYNSRRAEARLRRLLERPSYLTSAQRIGERVRAENGVATAAEAIEHTA